MSDTFTKEHDAHSMMPISKNKKMIRVVKLWFSTGTGITAMQKF